MRPTSLVRLVVLVVGFAYTGVLAMSGISLDSSTKLIVGWFPAVAAVVLLVWDLWAWRLPLLNRLTHRPRIDGLEILSIPVDE